MECVEWKWMDDVEKEEGERMDDVEEENWDGNKARKRELFNISLPNQL